MDKDRDVDDILDLTESESSSSSNTGAVFEAHKPFVLELHDIRKDDPMLADSVQPGGKKKQKKKKKGQPARERSSSSSESLSAAGSVTPSASEGREEFYDAHESYHAMSENQGPLASAKLRSSTHSNPTQNPKSTSTVAPSEQTTTSSGREPSTITKPSFKSD